MTTPKFEIYNAQEMLIQCLDDKEMFKQFLTMACQTLPTYKKELLTAIESGNLEVIEQKSHKLKSFSGNIKLTQLNNLLITIEKEAKENNLAAINAKYEELCSAFEAAEQALNIELTNNTL